MKSGGAAETAGSKQRRSGTIQSVSIAARFLGVLADADGPMALGELAKRGRTSGSTAHRYLQSLIKEGLAVQDPISGRYDLGPSALSIGVGALKRVQPVEVAARHVQALTERVAASGGVVIWTDRGPTIVRWHRGAYFSISSVGLGDVLPLDNTATGLVFQAYLSPNVVEVARKNQPPHFRGQPPSKEMLARIRSSFGTELKGHIASDIAGEAAPVFDAQHGIACVITTITSIDVTKADAVRAALIDAAREATRECGGGGIYASAEIA